MQCSVFKDRVARLMRSGAAHPEVWTRYRALVERHPIGNINSAIMLVSRRRRAELELQAAAIRNWGRCSQSRLTLMMLDEVHLILRMLRRHAPARFSELMMEIGGADLATRAWPRTAADAAE
jgi:hypothetical protein